MAQSVIGALRVNLGLDSAQFETGARRARGPRKMLQRQLRQLAVVAAAAGAALALAIRSGLRDVDRLAKGARSIDGTVASLQALELAGSDAGVAQGALTQSVQRMTREIARAAEEGGRGADALARLGLEASDLAAMDADERVATIADRMRELGFTSGQAANLLRDLGVRSAEMANLMTQGGGAIRAARRELESLGLALDENAVRGVERANDAMARISLAMQGFRNRLAASVAPALERLAVAFTDAMREGGGLRSALDAITWASRALARGIDLVADNLTHLIDLLRIVVATKVVMWIGGVVSGLIQLARAIRTTGIVMVAFTPDHPGENHGAGARRCGHCEIDRPIREPDRLAEQRRFGADERTCLIRCAAGLSGSAARSGPWRRHRRAWTGVRPMPSHLPVRRRTWRPTVSGRLARGRERPRGTLGEDLRRGLTRANDLAFRREPAQQHGEHIRQHRHRRAVGQAGYRATAQQLAQMLANQAFQMLFGAFSAASAAASTPASAAGSCRACTPAARHRRDAGLAWVGEEGPELVNFRGGERVFSNRDSQRMAFSRRPT
jgi:hypothetical protein